VAENAPPPIDGGRPFDWGKTSPDYAIYRAGPPESFYEKLLALDVGLSRQRILDLGTGTGVLARQFAKQGSVVAGIDISREQIQAAKTLADADGLDVDLRVAPAEQIPFPDDSFDVITANQCWLYFDKAKTIPEVKRVLVTGGLLVTSHFTWLPRRDRIAAASEELVLKHNPQWSAADFGGEVPPFPKWAQGAFNVKAFFLYEEPIPFTRDIWKGRIRACRGIGAAMRPDEVQRFDEAHDTLLRSIAGEDFTVLHQIGCHMFTFST